MERMQDEAQELQADGIVGAQIDERSHGWGCHVIEFFAIGTAVVPAEDHIAISEPTLVVALTDARLNRSPLSPRRRSAPALARSARRSRCRGPRPA